MVVAQKDGGEDMGFQGEVIVRLESYLRGRLKGPVSPLLDAFVRKGWRLDGGSILAVLFYGSCLQGSINGEGIVDLYIVVGSYRQFYGSWGMALLNWLLPPNVFYREMVLDKGVIRAKCAVMTLAQLERAVSPRWFHSYFWARFSQPMQAVYFKDSSVLARLAQIQRSALFTFAAKVVPLLPSCFSVRDFWQLALTLSYRAELRPEGRDRIKRLLKSSQDYFLAVTPFVLEGYGGPGSVEIHSCWRDKDKRQLDEPAFSLVISKGARYRARCGWWVRCVYGKWLSIMRLVKAAFTFKGGVSYALWKIERHSGVKIELSPFLKRHPLLAMVFASWRLLKTKAIR